MEKKLSNFKKTGTVAGIVIPQDTKFAANIKKNILPNIITINVLKLNFLL